MSQPPPAGGKARGRARGIQKPADAARPGASGGAARGGGPSAAAAATARPGVAAAGASRPSAPSAPSGTGAIPRTGPPQPGQPKKSSPESEPSARGSIRPRPGQGGGDLPARMHGLDLSSSGNGNGNGNNGNGNGHGDGNGNGKSVGRGGMRGRRQLAPVEIPRTRPTHVVSKLGLSGEKVKLQANYFCLETRADWVVYQYRVDFNVEEDRTVVKKAWLREHKEKLGNKYLFDGSVMFTSNRITQDNQPLNFVSMRQSDNMPVQITVRLVGELKRSHHMYLQIFNILVRRCLDALKLQLVGRNYFDPHAKVELRDYNIELWPGYVTSIRQFENNILMCAEITHKVMRTDTVFDFLNECTRQYGGTDWRNAFVQGILGQVVLTDYNNKTYRVDDVDFDKSPSTTFEGKNKESTSFVNYYKERYNIRIRDLRQPLLVSRPTARDIRGGRDQHCLLIPELCRLTGLTDRMRENYRLMSAMAEHTRVNPDARIDKLLAFNRRLYEQPSIKEEFSTWNMTLSKNLIEVPGRILAPEIVIVSNAQYSAGREADWTKELRSRPMLYNAPLNSLAVVVPTDLKRDADAFMQTLRRAAEGMSFRLPKPDYVECRSDRTGDVLSATEEYIGRNNPALIIFICSNNKGDRYAAIKKKCCVDRPIPSQVVLKKSMMSKGVMSIATKIAIQLNCKIGGAPWTVAIPFKKERPVMVCGYDVCHDTNQKSKSVGAFVASLNPTLSRWFSSVNHHSSGEELSKFLAQDMALALREFVRVNKVLPDRIVIYRDGVGEGQLHYVYHHEVNQIKEALTSVYGGPTWKLGYIIVTKRLNTRLFLNRRNPGPGTVVDDVITNPDHFDFFLVSQTVRQGTVAPTGYNVIHDNLGLAPDHIQQLSYKMTHLYYNWSGTVRVPAPCQYAHKLAFLVGQSLHRQPHDDLNTQLYFL